MSLMERLRKCAEISGSGDRLARESDIPRNTWQNYVTGKSTPNATKLETIVKITGVNGHWLLTGEGAMLVADMQVPASMDVDLNLVGECVELLELALNKFNRQLSPEKKRAAVEAMYRAHQGKKGVDQGLVDMIIKLAA